MSINSNYEGYTIIGIDPGSNKTGFGIIKTNGFKHEYITSGHINLTTTEFPQNLGKIFTELNKILTANSVQSAAIEDVFMKNNPSSAIKLGQARGAALVALTNHQLPVTTYSPRQIKKAVVGSGAAEKTQVQFMVKLLLKIKHDLQADEADALAIALCHAHSSPINLRNKNK
jgi:crossover junction endodeoxyribonuclease RuvC